MKNDIILSMGIHTYVAKIEPAEEGGYIAYFPSLPGCHTQGNSISNVIEMAKDALYLWISVLKDEGKVIPKEKISLITKSREMNIPLIPCPCLNIMK